MEAAAFAVRQNLETMREAGATIAACAAAAAGPAGALVAADRQRRHRRWRRTCARARHGRASAPRCSRRSAVGAATLRTIVAAADGARGARPGDAAPLRRAVRVVPRARGTRRALSPTRSRPGSGTALVARCRRRQTGSRRRARRTTREGSRRDTAQRTTEARRRAAARRRWPRSSLVPGRPRHARCSSSSTDRSRSLVQLVLLPSSSSPCGRRSRERAPRAWSGSSSPSWRPSPWWPSRSSAARGTCSRCWCGWRSWASRCCWRATRWRATCARSSRWRRRASRCRPRVTAC